MAYKSTFKETDDEIECEILESYGIFSRGNYSEGAKSWVKEVNLVSWNGRQAKLDIRNWQKDHGKCGKGITITREEAEELVKILNKILSTGLRDTNPKRRARDTVIPPKALKPFYDELGLIFGASPEKCKSARNTLLKKYHPDTYSGSLSFATRKTIKIKEAYEKILAWWNENS